eukprot:scaffold85159_cov20-Tisochrysis_lutea.AAC.1
MAELRNTASRRHTHSLPMPGLQRHARPYISPAAVLLAAMWNLDIVEMTSRKSTKSVHEAWLSILKPQHPPLFQLL